MIRDALASDLASIAAAMVRIQETHARAFPDVYRRFAVGEASSYLSALSNESDSHVRVVEVAGQAVAHAITRIQPRPESLFEHERRVGYVAQIEVEPAHRRNGYGRMLIEDCRELAEASSATRLVLDVWAFNETARDFFRATGWTDFGSKLSIDVGERQDTD